jgi:Tfp pilus assembly protein PilV
MKKRNPCISGFSLVEVTLALAVVVFGIVTILGLLAVGINSTHVSTTQTSATNILTEVASDLESTPNITPSYSPVSAKGSVAKTSPIFGITLPAGGTGAGTKLSPIYIGEDGQVTTAGSALYQLNVWTTASSATQQETFVRLLITWPAAAAYTSPQGYVENIIAINRT